MALRTIFRNSVILLLLVCGSALCQDLDPRAYLRVPVKTTTAFTGFSYSFGGVVTDPTLPIDNVKADVQSTTFGVSHSFGLFGKTTQVLMVLPYSWAQVSGSIREKDSTTYRSGVADARLRLTMLLLGGKAATLQEIVQAPKRTILGFGLNLSLPTGEFFPEKLVNLGTNRWALRPELALSQPLGERWLIDIYSGVWFFTNNKSFFPGTSVRGQEPMGAFQAHISYNIKPTLWVAFDATHYVGGRSTIDNIYQDDRQQNTRIGISAVIPTGRFSSLKFSASTGAVVRIGQDFTTFSLGWQRTWIKGLKK